MNILVVQNLLKKTQVGIDTATGGAEAIKLADDNAYDLILLDQRMPGMDGTETLKHIRSLESARNVSNPVICLTADAIRGARERYMNEGFTDYLTKPVEGRLLEKMLMTYLPEDKVQVYTSESSGSSVSDPMVEELEKAGFDTEKALVYTQNDLDFYKTILNGFAMERADRTSKLDDLMASGKLVDYSVIIHALKSNARTIGATELAEAAASLEMLSKNGEKDKAMAEHGPAMKLYKETADTIFRVLGEGTVNAENDMDSQEIMEFAPETDEDVLEFMPDTERD